MGKGVPAALLAAGVKSSFFKALITQGGVSSRLPEIQRVLGTIDSTINRDLIDLEKFLTLYYCRLDMNRYRLSFIDAGHTSFIYHNAEENSCWSIKGANMPLGFTVDQEFQEFILPLAKNDLLFFYSDGVSEVTNKEGDLFGLERIMQLIQAHSHLEPQELIRKVLNVTFFFAARDFEDDVTAISIRVKKDRNLPEKSCVHHFENTSGIDMAAIRENFSEDLEKIYSSQPKDKKVKLLIAFMEVLGNCISYTNSALEIKWRIYHEEIHVYFSFTGPDFDWFKKTNPDIERYQQGGFGSYLIEQGTDSALLLYGRNEKKRIVLIKGME
jgi:anti-sigma regulatory factor (Ser/Thr protein kinase)